MAHTSIDTVLNSLVLNKIPSMENFKYMQENGLINENEVYFIKESNPVLIMETDQWENMSNNNVILRGPLCTFKTGSIYKIKFFLDKKLVIQGEGKVIDMHILDLEIDNFRISISPNNNGTSRIWIGTKDDSNYDFKNNPSIQVYEI